MLNRRQFHASALALCATAATPVLAQAAYPNRPIKLIVPFAPGGGPDIMTRKVTPKLADILGQNVVVENVVGAGGILAGQTAARAAPDGYTILLGASTHITQKAMLPNVRFDPLKDFAPITRTTYSPSMLVVASDSPIRTLQDLIDAARREPGKLNYASGGVGSAAHLAGAALVVSARLDVVHVPYKGSVEIVPSILNGATQFAFPVASTAIPQINNGKIRALASSGATRMPQFPNLPTLREALNNDELAMDPWGGFWAPASTPAEIVDVLFRAFQKVYQDPVVRADNEAAGSIIALSQSPAEFRQFMEAETIKFQRLVKAANLAVAN